MPEFNTEFDTGLDVLTQTPIDDGEVQQGKADALLQPGGYTTIPEDTVVRVDKSQQGRPYARVFGRIIGPEEGRIGYGFSWVRQNRMLDGVDTGKPDQLFKNYCRLVDLYAEAHSAKATRVSDLVAFVQQTPLRLRLIQGRDGGDNFVVNISLPRDGA